MTNEEIITALEKDVYFLKQILAEIMHEAKKMGENLGGKN